MVVAEMAVWDEVVAVETITTMAAETGEIIAEIVEITGTMAVVSVVVSRIFWLFLSDVRFVLTMILTMQATVADSTMAVATGEETAISHGTNRMVVVVVVIGVMAVALETMEEDSAVEIMEVDLVVEIMAVAATGAQTIMMGEAISVEIMAAASVVER